MTQVKQMNTMSVGRLRPQFRETEIPGRFGAMIDTLDNMFPRLQDRRMFPRQRYIARLILAGEDGKVVELWTRDISVYNVGYVGDVRLETATTATLSIDLPNGGRYEAHGRIMRCREFEPGCFEGFINFTRQNLPDDVLAMMTAA